ncbi:variable large family protein (plasmid) [Borrelia coriaceae]|uniref:Variable large protein n=1 Tax=Borrelia coriaceae ATCC 43381 TaxID=1408429 RepID=W5SYM5_9SPIR|nr:variable large family protein [Borrelia coriaceae]AHH11922.1 Variable major outer membrane lipoprotein [Borrelia coriaceae ATCC 43381]UPA17141.1 variable large family protein [Borrelia coriaceae]
MKINIKNIRIRSICATLFISLFLSCNNGIEELQKQRDSILSISNLRQQFLDVFSSFSDMFTDAFGITADTTKKQFGEHLGKVGDAVQAVKGKLENIKADENFDLIKDKAESIIAKAIETLGKIIDGANKIKQATASASGKIANSDSAGDAVQAETESVKGLVEGIVMFCEAAKGVGMHPKGNANKPIADSQEVGNLFNQTSNVGSDAKALIGANRAVHTASGADILAAIEAAKDITSKVAGNINAATSAYDVAIANKSNGNLTTIKTNASAIAAGLALRAMAKQGKLATVATHAPGEAVNAVLVGVVGKTLNEIVSTIKRTVDKCLKDVSECIKENSTSEVKTKSK